MKALRLATSPRDRQKLDAKCREWLTRAEKWKKEDSNRRTLTTREEIILLEGAKLNGAIFPPWITAPGPDQFAGDLYWCGIYGFFAG